MFYDDDEDPVSEAERLDKEAFWGEGVEETESEYEYEEGEDEDEDDWEYFSHRSHSSVGSSDHRLGPPVEVPEVVEEETVGVVADGTAVGAVIPSFLFLSLIFY